MRFICATWLTFVAAVSLAPLSVKTALGTKGHWHNPLHFIVFFATGVLLLSPSPQAPSRALRAIMLALFCAGSELLQAVIYHNRYEWSDLYLDVLGLSCAWLLVAALGALRRRTPFSAKG